MRRSGRRVMPKLYQITGDIIEAIELYNSVETDEQLLDVEGRLNGLQIRFEEKAVAVAKHIINESGDLDAIETEIERLTALKRTRENGIKRLKNYILSNMLAANTPEIDGGTMKLKVRKNPPSVNVLDETQVPDTYKRTKTVIEIDKKEILAAWKAGQIGVAGTEVKQGSRLEIK